MPVNPRSKNCVRDELRRFKAGELHSGTGTSGKKGPVVTNKRQAVAIALSACGKSTYAERLESIGFSPKSAEEVSSMMAEIDWDKQFESGTTGAKTKRENKTTKGVGLQNLDIDNRPGKQKGSEGKGKNESQGSIGPVSLPKGNPQPGPRSLQLKGMRAFQEPLEGVTGSRECPPKKPQKPRKPPSETNPEPEQAKSKVPQPEQAPTNQAERKRKPKCSESSGALTGFTG